MTSLPHLSAALLLACLASLISLACLWMIWRWMSRQDLPLQHSVLSEPFRSGQVSFYEQEMNRVAHQLHDEISSRLNRLHLALAQMIPLPAAENPGWETARVLLNETIRHTNQITESLVPAALEPFGLAAAMEDLCDQLRRHRQHPIYLECTGTPQPDQLPARKLAVYRFLQAFLTTIPDDPESAVYIRLASGQNGLRIRVQETGPGLSASVADRLVNPRVRHCLGHLNALGIHPVIRSGPDESLRLQIDLIVPPPTVPQT